MYTPAAFRYWCDKYVNLHSYVRPDNQGSGSNYLELYTITDTHRGDSACSSSSILCMLSKVIYLIPDYSTEPLSSLDYNTFVDRLFEAGEAYEGDAFDHPDREEAFWLYHAIILNDYHHEGSRKMTEALTQVSYSLACT